jgi:hypothetical protein
MTTVKSNSGKWALYGNLDAEIVVCGHSHVASILEASVLPENVALSETGISVCYSSDWNSGPPGDKEYWEFVAKLGRGKHIVIVWNGNQHNANFMFQTDPKFTLLGVDDNFLEEKVVPISSTMIKNFFKPSFEELTEIVASMFEAKSVTLMNGPAPKPTSHIENCITKEKYFTDIAKSLDVDLGDLVITSDALRLELWNVLAGLLEKCANDLDINFSGAPTESRDIFGMLLPEYRAPDVTHANSNYGILLIKALKNLNGKVRNE